MTKVFCSQPCHFNYNRKTKKGNIKAACSRNVIHLNADGECSEKANTK